MDPLLCFHRSSNSPSNQITEDESKHHAIPDDKEILNGYDSDTEGNSEINAFEQARIEVIECRIASREI